MVTKQLEKDLEYTYERLSDEEISRLENSSILITGCAGFLGFYFVHFFYQFREKLHLKKIICLDNFMLGYPNLILSKIELRQLKKQKRQIILFIWLQLLHRCFIGNIQ